MYFAISSHWKFGGLRSLLVVIRPVLIMQKFTRLTCFLTIQNRCNPHYYKGHMLITLRTSCWFPVFLFLISVLYIQRAKYVLWQSTCLINASILYLSRVLLDTIASCCVCKSTSYVPVVKFQCNFSVIISTLVGIKESWWHVQYSSMVRMGGCSTDLHVLFDSLS